MAERKMSERGFLHRANGKISALAFLTQHREFLTAGTLAHFTSPILQKLDDGELLPTPALEQIKGVVWDHYAATELLKSEKAMQRAMAPKSEKPYVSTILDAKGNVVTKINEEGKEVELRQGFATDSEASGWVDRRLFEGASDWHGTVVATKLRGKAGDVLTIVILREDSIARILKKKPAMATRKVGGASSTKLGFGVKCAQDTCHFSKG